MSQYTNDANTANGYKWPHGLFVGICRLEYIRWLVHKLCEQLNSKT